MNEMSRFVIQRASAALLAPLVLAHLALIVVASNQGLSAAEILERTRGSLGWAAFYGVFVIAAAAHGATGPVRTGVQRVGTTATGDVVTTRAHRARDHRRFMPRRAGCAFVMHPERLCKVYLLPHMVVVARDQ